MEETKKKEEEKVEFNLEDEVEKSRILKEFPVKAKYEESRGRFVSFSLKMVARIDGKNVPHVRDERLREQRHQFLIKFLHGNKEQGKDSYDGVFQVRENNETKKKFYCWVIDFDNQGYRIPFLVERDEKKFLESFFFKDEKVGK